MCIKKIKEHKLQVIENLTGHGIGTSLHQEPQHVFNYFDPWDNLILKDGMCLAVEPFVSTKAKTVGNSNRDEWELVAMMVHILLNMNIRLLLERMLNH